MLIDLDPKETSSKTTSPPPPSAGSPKKEKWWKALGGFSLPSWVYLMAALLGGLAVCHSAVWHLNDAKPFALSDKLDHGGPWYRQAALAPVDWIRSRHYYIIHDVWGRKSVIYEVGGRRFLQKESGAPAVEMLPES